MILPNGGPSVRHGGVELGFHGEACKIAWNYQIVERNGEVTVICETSLRRSPLDAKLSFTLTHHASSVRIDAAVRNVSDQQVDLMWGFHPAYGESLTGPQTRLHIRAEDVEAHPEQFASKQILNPGFLGQWPIGPDGSRLDYLFDGNGATADLMYLKRIEGWYVIHNELTGLAATMKWDNQVFPYVWLWQECRDHSGYPWFGRYHIVGVEPFTSYPSMGLEEAIRRGTAVQLAPRATISTSLHIGATQFVAQRNSVVAGVGDGGLVEFKSGVEDG